MNWKQLKMEISFTPNGWEEFEYWIDNDLDIVARIKDLIKSIRQNPFKGIGKPEPLRYDLKGYWSRRITGEHRIVYKVSGTKGVDQKCIIIQCRFHYDN
ncbi:MULTISPECIES: Txe/YoeB family addiction module toxin [unclassified Flavobacterium]|uniref:Txe/YoeB family addiction module toxin n=1 Tax=unclassified Flavobacterium TaxID=196869 RepID=UPI0025C1CAEC|nr:MULTISPECIES: Txe/YoeB family addiction module toxin [unclassified Flavobacterium]